MTRGQWSACRRPEEMLRWLTAPQTFAAAPSEWPPLPSMRQARLLALACWARCSNWRHRPGDVRTAYADFDAGRTGGVPTGATVSRVEDVLRFASECNEWGAASPAWRHLQKHKCNLIRCVFSGGPVAPLGCGRGPFGCPAHRPAWLTAEAVSLAGAAYRERLEDSSLDPLRLAVLADCLEEAGCDREDVVSHLRAPGPHVPGCRAVEALTGRG